MEQKMRYDDMIGSNMIKGVWCCLIFFNLLQYFNPSIPSKLLRIYLLHCFTHKSPFPIPAPEPFQAVLEWPHETHFTVTTHKFQSEKKKSKQKSSPCVFLSRPREFLCYLLYSLATLVVSHIGKHDFSEILGLQRAGCNHRSDACCGTSCAQTGISWARNCCDISHLKRLFFKHIC